MRLKSVKLAGFKSFVDPTIVHLPSNLCAIVGPNGCGKSNIIDAVRWVMGESSAKNLRGEHMTDVIFSGSSSRKPVAQASVELIFDNSDGKITGEYASYNEISLRRLVNSESISSYYLNGTKCRRRDITDVLMGTGLGPRSYSIIEQGMVSRLIESKPEELRVFIEEAAGISKYKERRRETESRIKRTRENLERLADIRDELQRQLQHLQRQAKSAEKYATYKQQERDATAQLNALRWQVLDREVTEVQQQISALEVKLEASIAGQRSLDAQIEQQRSDGIEVDNQYREVQASFYSLGSEITHMEQNIEYQQQRKQQLTEDLRLTVESLENAQNELKLDLDKIASLDKEISKLELELKTRRAEEKTSVSAREKAEQTMLNWQHDWDEFNTESANTMRDAEVEQQRIEHLENIVEQGAQRSHKLEKEQKELVAGPEEQEIAELDASISVLASRHDKLQSVNNNLNEKIESTRKKLKSTERNLDKSRTKLQSMLGHQSSLEALQQAAMGKQEGTIAWLDAHQLSKNPRVVDDLKVDSGWESAVETVLGHHLQAVCVNTLDSVSDVLESFAEGELNLLDTSVSAPGATTNSTIAADSLEDKVKSPRNISSLMTGVYCADSLQEALSLRAQLNAYESCVTRQGIWIGSSWLRVAKGFDEKEGMIQRQDELKSLAEDISSLQAEVAKSSKQLEWQQTQLSQQEQEKEKHMQEQTQLSGEIAELSGERSGKGMTIEHVSERRKNLAHELAEIEKQSTAGNENITTSRLSLQTALDAMEKDTLMRGELLRSRDEYRSLLDQARQQALHEKDLTHQIALRHESLFAQLNSLKTTLDRISSQVKSLKERKSQLQESLLEADEPIPEMKESLEEQLTSRVSIESKLSAAKAKVDEIEHTIRGLENKRNEIQETTQRIRDELVGKQLGIEGATVKRSGLEQQLKENSYDLAEVVSNLTQKLTVEGCEQELEKVGKRIQRLGAINLAAIEEYSTQSERKLYLDSQNDDLESALRTLQSAIRKIDKETRTRFKETFDRVNDGLQELFPKVFGGGHAYLDMIGDDLLDTGITIMARPPGKRNSTIHLLSGGEKAMTAIALVFAIFQLTPSPFCMLDEVDAPLDDINVSRFARLLEEMSDVVQFIFITHNRITMEMAKHLLGVTMNEPGVSRLVAVDVDEAEKMAAM